MEVVRTEVDGVPVFWTEGKPGDEHRAALVFRVGRADESLARGGLSHLVEHLALHAIGEADSHFNGAVDATTTMFVTHGKPDDVAKFLTSVCDSLRALPMERLEDEKKILETEAQQRDAGLAGQLLLWRYGAASYGLQAYDEHGLATYTADDVQEWVARWFTRQNAAVALVGGPPPEGLRLVLPEGERRPVPEATSALPQLPAYFQTSIKGVALSGIVERSTAATVYVEALGRRLHRVLRRDGALSYTTNVDYSPRTGDTAQIVAYADGLAEARPELAERFLAELDRIADEPMDAEEFAEMVAAVRKPLTSDEYKASRSITHCMAELLGRPHRTTDDLLAELDALKPQDVQDVGRAVLDTALLMLPHGQEPQGARFHPAPTASVVAVEGRVHTRYGEPQAGLIVGPDGATALSGSSMATVRFDRCGAVLAWPDGARLLTGLDGFTVGIEPTLWDGGAEAVAAIDRHVPAGLVVPMPARPAENIPAPPDGAVTSAGKRRKGPLLDITELPGKVRSWRRRPAWDDAALAAALPRVRKGDLAAGLEILARTREDAELRSLYMDELDDAAVGHSDALTRMAADAPDDPDVQLWLGGVRIAEAWKARSAARAEYVSAEMFGRFWRRLALAGPPLYRAAELLPADAAPWEKLMWHSIGMQLGRDEQDRLWRELTERSPFLYSGHISRSQALAKKWWGSHAELLDFAEAAVAAAEPGDPVTAVLAVAHLEVGGDDDRDDLVAYLGRPSVHAALADAADRWQSAPGPHPRALDAHHHFGAVFYMAGDHERARRHLSHVGRSTAPVRAWGYALDADRLLDRARREVRA